jgi:hypothetical protein
MGVLLQKMLAPPDPNQGVLAPPTQQGFRGEGDGAPPSGDDFGSNTNAPPPPKFAMEDSNEAGFFGDSQVHTDPTRPSRRSPLSLLSLHPSRCSHLTRFCHSSIRLPELTPLASLPTVHTLTSRIQPLTFLVSQEMFDEGEADFTFGDLPEDGEAEGGFRN